MEEEEEEKTQGGRERSCGIIRVGIGSEEREGNL